MLDEAAWVSVLGLFTFLVGEIGINFNVMQIRFANYGGSHYLK